MTCSVEMVVTTPQADSIELSLIFTADSFEVKKFSEFVTKDCTISRAGLFNFSRISFVFTIEVLMELSFDMCSIEQSRKIRKWYRKINAYIFIA